MPFKLDFALTSDNWVELFKYVHLHTLALIALSVRELRPDLNTEAPWSVVGTFVEKSYTAEFVRLRKLTSNRLKDKGFPHLLDSGDTSIKVKSELASVLVDHVLPLGNNRIFEKRHRVDSSFISLVHVSLDLLCCFIEEKVLDFAVFKVFPSE